MDIGRLVRDIAAKVPGTEAYALAQRLPKFVASGPVARTEPELLDKYLEARNSLDTLFEQFERTPLGEGAPLYAGLHQMASRVLDLYAATGELLREPRRFPLTLSDEKRFNEQLTQCEQMIDLVFDKALASYRNASERYLTAEHVDKIIFTKLNLATGQREPVAVTPELEAVRAQKDRHYHEKACFDLVVFDIMERKATIDWNIYPELAQHLTRDEFRQEVTDRYRRAVHVEDSPYLGRLRELNVFEC